MNRTRPLLILVALLLAVLTGCSSGLERYGGFTFVSPGGQTELTYPAAERGTIGDLSGPDLTSDGTIHLSDYAGKIMVINVWGSWCGPCRAEADSLSLAATLTADQGVQFLGIDVRDTREAGADFQAGKKTPYPSIFDPSMRTLLSISGYPTSSIPSTIVLDREHRVAHIFLRVIQTGELVQTATDLAQETADSAPTSPSAVPPSKP